MKEVSVKDFFYRIIMHTRDGKKLYLTENTWYGKNSEKINCTWDFNYNNALWFETYDEAEEFAKGYFKNFTGYEIEEFFEYI